MFSPEAQVAILDGIVRMFRVIFDAEKARRGERRGSVQNGAEIAKEQAPTSSPGDEAPQNQALEGSDGSGGEQ